MPAGRILGAATVLSLALAHGAAAQIYRGQQTTIQIPYHEAIPATGDEAQARVKIYEAVRNDCDIAAKTFSRTCVVTRIFFNDNGNWNPNFPHAAMLNATADLSLIDGKPAGTAPSSSTPSSPAAPPAPAKR